MHTKRVKWIEHKGVKILYEDYSNLQGDELLEVIEDARTFFADIKEPVPVLLNYSGITVNKKALTVLTEGAKELRDLHKKIASVGLTSTQLVIAEIPLQEAELMDISGYFQDMEEALDYLVSE
jgi:hypothetical protein